MNPQFLIAKLAANASDTSWSQAYSTLNFYVALSVSATEPTEKPLAQIGKELLERLQREYFSLDEKTLDSIKQAVESTVESAEPNITHSLILVTNNADTLYIITSGLGTVAIKRKEKLGIIAKGAQGSVLSFSGPLHHQDLIVIQTSDFAEKIPNATLIESLDSLNVTDISENLAPHLHNSPSGGEAAILLLYTNPEVVAAPAEESDEDEIVEESENESETQDITPTDEPEEKPSHHLSAPLFDDDTDDKKSQNSRFFIPSPANLLGTLRERKKMIVGIIILILLIGLIGSIFLRTRQEESAQNGEAITQAVASAQSEYEEGEALEPLNRPLALEKYTSAQKILTDTKNSFPDDPELEQVNALLVKVEQKLSEFSGGTKVENGEKLVTSSALELDEIYTVSIKGGTLFATDKSSNLSTITEDGELDENFKTDATTIIDTSANSEFAFLLTNSGVLRVDLGSGDENELFELDSARQSIDVFGSNIYLAHSGDKMVEKYAPSSYAASDYLIAELPATPISMSIDGSVYVLYDNGKVGKFTRGADDGFNITGIQGTIGKKAFIYTEEEFTNLYVLDTTNQRLLITAKNGEVKQEFSWDVFKNATDFAVDESAKTVYVATPNDLYTFSF